MDRGSTFVFPAMGAGCGQFRIETVAQHNVQIPKSGLALCVAAV